MRDTEKLKSGLGAIGLKSEGMETLLERMDQTEFCKEGDTAKKWSIVLD